MLGTNLEGNFAFLCMKIHHKFWENWPASPEIKIFPSPGQKGPIIKLQMTVAYEELPHWAPLKLLSSPPSCPFIPGGGGTQI